MVLIQTKDVVKDYNSSQVVTHVLKKINIEIMQDDFCGIVGPSGSGKTTLLYVLSGLEKATSGNVFLFDRDLTSFKESEMQNLRKNDIGFVFQFYNLLPNLTVYENILLSRIIAKKEDNSEIEEVLELVGMSKFAHYYPNQLSGGMQQRVAIARAIVNQPKLIFADEPTGNLDQKNGLEIMKILQDLNTMKHITIVMVTHNEDNLSFCNRKIQLLDGVVEKDELISL
ncbi:MAG: ABC transporter ATP-binding protein [Firmicutes bacterium]|nr:ABC transporter ATP-binding protein [Bacillota bacterium]